MKRRDFSKFIAAAGFAAIALFYSHVQAAEVLTNQAPLEGRYNITLMGMQIGIAQLKANVLDENYKIDVWTRLTGLAGVMTGGKGAASASGSLSGASVKPAKFAVTTATGDKSVSVRMVLSGGSLQALKITPPLPERKQRIALRNEDTRNVIDPVSALLMPAAGRARAGDPSACDRTLPLFDGSVRFDIPLSFLRTQQISSHAYSGNVTVCAGRYRPIAGHVPNRPETTFMENNRDIEVWLAPSPDERLYIPYRISVRSPLGLVVIEASQFPSRPEETTTKPTLRASN